MQFRPRLAVHEVGVKSGTPVVSLALPPRSLVVFSGPAYTEQMHSIEATAVEMVPEKFEDTPTDQSGVGLSPSAPIANADEAGLLPGDRLLRDTRISLTFRRVYKG